MKIFKKIIVFIFIITFSFYAIAEEVDSLTDLKNEFNNLKEQLNENIKTDNAINILFLREDEVNNIDIYFKSGWDLIIEGNGSWIAV